MTTPESTPNLAGRIVVGVDGSEQAHSALEWAAGWATQRGTGLTVLTARPGPTLSEPDYPAVTNILELSVERAKNSMNHAAEGARTTYPGLDVDTWWTLDSPAQALIEASGLADLVVIGTRQLGRITAFFIGSVGDHVIPRLRGPAVVVPYAKHVERIQAGAKMVLGLDATAGPTPAAEWAFATAAAVGARLEVLHAWAFDYLWESAAVGLEEEDLRNLLDRERGRLHEAIAPYVAQFPDVVVEPRIVRDDPATALTEVSRSTPLLVMGTRGRGGFPGMRLGSTSRKVLRSTDCPTVIVPDSVE